MIEQTLVLVIEIAVAVGLQSVRYHPKQQVPRKV
jgi:hypothetical protein